MKLVDVGFVALCGALTLCMPEIDAQSFRLAEFSGRGMSFKICRGTLGSLAMSAAIRRVSSFGAYTFRWPVLKASFLSPRHEFDCGGDNWKSYDRIRGRIPGSARQAAFFNAASHLLVSASMRAGTLRTESET
jgi:hypothetical protein